MEAMKALRGRHSTRRYTDRPVPRELIEQVVDAGRLVALGYGEGEPRRAPKKPLADVLRWEHF